jgi:hypothetical protein
MKNVSRWQMTVVMLIALATGLWIICGRPGAGAARQDASVAAFLQQHWQFPIAPQGPVPAAYSPLEASLHPGQCGVCHPLQYRDWQTTIHSRSMGPGVYGQLLAMEQSDPATYALCATCHTPLAEQIPFVESDGTHQPFPAFDAALQQAGLTCAGCHVRQHQRFGPPRRPDRPAIPPGTTLPHGGFTASEAYERSEFCQPCHQFEPDGFALNGKLLENTYEEWRQSRYAADGTQCQTCHMPDRRHLWRGIHDADMVRQAITVDIAPHAPSYVVGDRLQMTIVITNSGAGHYFPTYVTPKIFVQGYLLDAQGQAIDGTTQQSIVGREVELDLSREVYDTRIPPGESHTMVG